MSYGKEQYFLIAAATLFLVGAVFMLVNTFGGVYWALWAGVGCASAALLVYAILTMEQRVFNKKFTVTRAEQERAEQNAKQVTEPTAEQSTAEQQPTTEQPAESAKPAPKKSNAASSKTNTSGNKKPKATTSKKEK